MIRAWETDRSCCMGSAKGDCTSCSCSMHMLNFFSSPPATMHTRACAFGCWCTPLLPLHSSTQGYPLTCICWQYNECSISSAFENTALPYFMLCAIQNPQQLTTKLSIVQNYPLSVFQKLLHSPCLRMMSIMACYISWSECPATENNW